MEMKKKAKTRAKALFRPTTQEMEEWKKYVGETFPEWKTELISLPPVYFPRYVTSEENIEGLPVKIVNTSQQSSSTGTDVSPEPKGNAETQSSTNGHTAQSSASSPTPTTPEKQIARSPALVAPGAPIKSRASSSAASSHPRDVQAAKRRLPFGAPVQQSKEQSVPVQESDERGDRAHKVALLCLQGLGKKLKEPMLLISELQFYNYLRDSKSRANIGSKLQGDIDLFALNRHRGILLMEVKSIGYYDQADAGGMSWVSALPGRISKIINQLNKVKKFVKDNVLDGSSKIPVQTSAIMPFIKSADLKKELTADPSLLNKFLACLGASDVDQAVELCLCEEQFEELSSSTEVPEDVIRQVESWWRVRMGNSDCGMSEDKYMDLLARLCGPATAVTVHSPGKGSLVLRTKGEAVSETGRRMSSLLLTPEQYGLVQCDTRKRVFLTGPPGTGKSVVLALKGLKWLRGGHNVHIVSSRFASFAASCLMEFQLKQMRKVPESGFEEEEQQQTEAEMFGEERFEEDMETDNEEEDMETDQALETRQAGTVIFHEYDFWNDKEEAVDQATRELKEAAEKKGELFMILDEYATNDNYKPYYTKLLSELSKTAGEKLHVWAASVRNRNIPENMEKTILSVPLRNPPSVLNEISKAISKEKDVYDYDYTRTHHLPADGPQQQRLEHGGEGHDGEWPVNCYECGRLVGRILLEDLGVRKEEDDAASSQQSTNRDTDPLLFEDVLILTRSYELADDSPFVKALQDQNIDLVVITSDEPEGKENNERVKMLLKKVARSENKGVIVARSGGVCGLERKIVVRLPGKSNIADVERDMAELEWHDRIHLMSRSTAHLIIVDMPPQPSRGVSRKGDEETS